MRRKVVEKPIMYLSVIDQAKPYEMFCTLWYHLYNLKKVKSTYEVVLLLVKFQAEAWIFAKSNTPPWMFFVFLKLYKWYHIAQSVTYTDGSKRCSLCLTEKCHILTTSVNLINKRFKLFSICRHDNKFYLINYKAIPPDN